MIKKFITLSVVFVSWLLLWPLAILYWLSYQKHAIYQDTMADMKFRSANIKGTSAVLYVLLLDKYYRSLFYYRIGFLSLLVSWLWRGDNSFSITAKNIMGGVFCVHPSSTYLNAHYIGRNFTCRQNTTIGNKSDDKPSERPTIGDNVSLGANVVIIGNVRIANNVTIGAGSVVVKDVPDNAIVVGNPARIIKYQYEKCNSEHNNQSILQNKSRYT